MPDAVHNPAPAEAAHAAPRPTLSLFDSVAIIVGVVIGAGIFQTPALIAAQSRSELFMLLAWVGGGAVTLVGALCVAELASAYPHPGGNYHYLMRAFGVGPAFLLAWGRLAVLQTGSIALLGFVFGDYASQIYSLGEHSPAVYAALGLTVLTLLNYLGVRQGKWTQNLLTSTTVLGLVALIAVGLLLGTGGAAEAPAPATGAASSPAAALGVVMIFVLLTYGGWNEAVYISAEVRDVRRNMLRALLISTAVITVAYVLVNLALLRGLGLAGMAGTTAVAAELMRVTVGPGGALFISALVSIAVFGSMNATILTGARTNYAMGRDFRIFSFLGQWRGRGETPGNALLVQGAVALALVLLGAFTRQGFSTMVEFTTPAFWTFMLLTAVSLVVLRRREPATPRPYRVPLYPLLPVVFILTSAYMLYSSLAYARDIYSGLGTLVGVVALLGGLLLLPFLQPGRALRNHRPGGLAAPVIMKER
jgi:APA family basic amino acid/polyamine antiporter